MSRPHLRVAQWATGNIGGRALREVIRHPALDLDDVVALLDCGANIVTTCGELSADGRALGDEPRRRVLDACTRGNTSIYATGSSPGFITDALPFALLSLQRRFDGIEIEEYADLSQRNSPHLLFELMGYGRPVASFDPRRSAGTIAAQRTVIVGRNGADAVVRFTPTWYCTSDLEPEWDVRPTGWRVRVHGDAPLDVSLPFPVAVEDLGSTTPAYTANRPVNAIPYVCAARPGILSTADLPPVLPSGPTPD